MTDFTDDFRARLQAMRLEDASMATMADHFGLTIHGLRARMAKHGLSMIREIAYERRRRFIEAWKVKPGGYRNFVEVCGFIDEYGFRRAFPKFMGCTWSEWRERHG